MPRSKQFSKKNIYDKIKEKITEQKNEHNVLPTLDLVKHAGGSINNLPVKTKEFNTWLESHQKINPFIGKHAQYSQEDSIEEIQLDDQVQLVGTSADSILDTAEASAEKFNPESKFGNEEEDLGDAPKHNSNNDKKFIDLIICENMTKKLMYRSEDEIVEETKKAIKSYHEKEDYETPIDIYNVVQQSKILFIEQAKEAEINTQKLLK